jgi:hypothetical protein
MAGTSFKVLEYQKDENTLEIENTRLFVRTELSGLD